MEEIKIYLAGASFHEPDEGREWREKMSERLKQISEWSNKKIKIINPLNYYAYSSVNKEKTTDKEIKEFFFHMISKCDLVLCNATNSSTSPGTMMELQYANDHNIPVLSFGEGNIYSWLLSCCQAYRSTSTEILDYIRDYYLS